MSANLTPHDVWLLGLAVRADKQARAKEHAALAERDAVWVARIKALADDWERTTTRARPAFLVAADELRELLDAEDES